MSETRVDIVMRTRNRPHFLRRAIRSVLNQSCADWRIQLVATGDLAPVDALLAEFEPELAGRVVRVPVPDSAVGVLGELINLGMRSATAPFVGMLDDDDSWEPRFLEACLGVLENPPHPSARGAVARSNVIQESIGNDGSFTMLRTDPLNPELRNLTLFRMGGTNRFPPNSFVFAREAFHEMGEFDASLPVLEDWHFNLRFMEKYEIVLLDEYLSNYHQRPASTSAEGSNSNTVTGGEGLHRFHEARIINERLREEMAAGRPGLGFLMSQSQALREADDEIRRLRKKLDAMSDKIGKIDSRTRQLKDRAGK